MIKHIVMWKIKDTKEGNKEENIRKMKEMIEALAYKIPEVVTLEVGVDFNRSEKAFDLVLDSSFKSKEDLNAYQVHVEHKKVLEFATKVVSERAVVDYEI